MLKVIFLMNSIKILVAGCMMFFAASAWAGAYEDMIHAIKIDDERAVADLLKRGVDVDSVSPDGESLLMLAVKEGKPSMVKTLLAARPKVSARNGYGETPLMLAALRGQTEIVRLLVDRGAEVNHPGWTALMYSATSNHVNIARILIARGAEIGRAHV